MYVIHDEAGNILHTISGPDANYGRALTDAGQKWIFLEGEFAFNPMTQRVDVATKKLIERDPLTLDAETQSPLQVRKKDAEAVINDHLNREAAGSVQKDMEYRRKKEIAESVLSGGEAPAEFAEEAGLMGISVADLAAMIQARPDTIMDRAIRRRRAVLAARSAATVEELNGILAAHSNGVTR